MENSALRNTALAILSAAAFIAGPGTTAAQAAGTCDRVASPQGSDTAAGTVDAPVKSIQALIDGLSTDQTGCFAAGTYTQNSIKLSTAGVTLTGLNGAKPEIVGRIWISADRVTIDSVKLNGKNSTKLPSPSITGADDVLRNNEITNDNTTICITLGSIGGYGRATRTIVERNQIHNCGALPATNFDHGIYVEASDGAIIRDNWIYDNANRGIQLYPDGDGSKITGNVIDGNGEGIVFGGDDTHSSDNNMIEHNVISNSKLRDNVESAYGEGAPIGTGNVVRDNCIHGGAYDDGDSGILSPQVGFTVTTNLDSAPSFVNRAAGDLSLTPGSACASVLTGGSVTATVSLSPPAAPTVQQGRRVRLHGSAHGATTVRIISSHGLVRKVSVTDNKFRASLPATGKGVTKFHAEAAGAQSGKVKIRVKPRAQRHHRGHHHG